MSFLSCCTISSRNSRHYAWANIIEDQPPIIQRTYEVADEQGEVATYLQIKDVLKEEFGTTMFNNYKEIISEVLRTSSRNHLVRKQRKLSSTQQQERNASTESLVIGESETKVVHHNSHTEMKIAQCIHESMRAKIKPNSDNINNATLCEDSLKHFDEKVNHQQLQKVTVNDAVDFSELKTSPGIVEKFSNTSKEIIRLKQGSGEETAESSQSRPSIKGSQNIFDKNNQSRKDNIIKSTSFIIKPSLKCMKSNPYKYKITTNLSKSPTLNICSYAFACDSVSLGCSSHQSHSLRGMRHDSWVDKPYAVYFIEVSIPSNTRNNKGNYKDKNNDTKNVDKSSTSCKWTIFRRYSEFLLLKNLLMKRHFSMIATARWQKLPKLPPRRLLGSFSKTFINWRRKKLENWLSSIVSLPEVRNLEIVRQFLTYKANIPPENMSAPIINVHSLSSPQDFRYEYSRNTKATDQTISSSSQEESKTALADFILMKMVGVGAYGRVILVKHRKSGKPFAMKVMSKNQVLKEDRVAIINRERRLLALVRHPFICSLHHAFQTAHKLYLILDYCPGGELLAVIGRSKFLSERRTRFYTAELVSAIGYLHSLGIVYRDLKPENILLDGDGHIQLVDFGLSKDGVHEITGCTNSFCGTPEYLAPEIVMGQPHGKAVDWWSLGMLVYEMMTGLPPWYTSDRLQLFTSICEGTLKFPWSMSREAKRFIEALLHKDPYQRLGSRVEYGFSDVKEHNFFKAGYIDWWSLDAKKVCPPFCPSDAEKLLERNNGSAKSAEFNATFFDPEITCKPLNDHFNEMDEEENFCDMPDDFKGFLYSFNGSVSNHTHGVMEN